jgi:hypothetical protein
MGKEKEEFLEKLGECYSISTKNGTLSLSSCAKEKQLICINYSTLITQITL